MADVAVGITIVFGVSGFSCELLDVNVTGWSRDSIQTSHQGTTTRHTHTPADLADSGNWEITFNFDPETDPPIDDDPETVTITWPDSDIWTATAFMTDYNASAPLNDKMTGSATLKISGDVTVTPSV